MTLSEMLHGKGLADLSQRGDSWMFGREASYERGGDVKDVCFPVRADTHGRR